MYSAMLYAKCMPHLPTPFLTLHYNLKILFVAHDEILKDITLTKALINHLDVSAKSIAWETPYYENTRQRRWHHEHDLEVMQHQRREIETKYIE